MVAASSLECGVLPAHFFLHPNYSLLTARKFRLPGIASDGLKLLVMKMSGGGLFQQFVTHILCDDEFNRNLSTNSKESGEFNINKLV